MSNHGGNSQQAENSTSIGQHDYHEQRVPAAQTGAHSELDENPLLLLPVEAANNNEDACAKETSCFYVNSYGRSQSPHPENSFIYGSQEGTSASNMTFPQRLMALLSNDSLSGIITWLPHGKGFIVSNKERFVGEVLPRYFVNCTKYTSFTRKLNRWNFTRVTKGPATGAYYHPLFKRDEPQLCLQMTCLVHPSVQHIEPMNTMALGLATPAMIGLGLSLAAPREATSQRSSSSPTTANVAPLPAKPPLTLHTLKEERNSAAVPHPPALFGKSPSESYFAVDARVSLPVPEERLLGHCQLLPPNVATPSFSERFGVEEADKPSSDNIDPLPPQTSIKQALSMEQQQKMTPPSLPASQVQSIRFPHGIEGHSLPHQNQIRTTSSVHNGPPQALVSTERPQQLQFPKVVEISKRCVAGNLRTTDAPPFNGERSLSFTKQQGSSEQLLKTAPSQPVESTEGSALSSRPVTLEGRSMPNPAPENTDELYAQPRGLPILPEMRAQATRNLNHHIWPHHIQQQYLSGDYSLPFMDERDNFSDVKQEATSPNLLATALLAPKEQQQQRHQEDKLDIGGEPIDEDDYFWMSSSV